MHEAIAHKVFTYYLQKAPCKPFPLVHEAHTCNAFCETLAKNESLQCTSDLQRIINLINRRRSITQNDEFDKFTNLRFLRTYANTLTFLHCTLVYTATMHHTTQNPNYITLQYTCTLTFFDSYCPIPCHPSK